MRYLIGVFLALVVSATCSVAQTTYQIAPGDTLSIEVLEDPQLNRSLLVLPDGTINFPFAGTLRAGGRTVGEIQAQITNAIASNFASPPNVFVTVASVRPAPERLQQPLFPVEENINVYMLGEIGAPGLKTLRPGTTLVQAMAFTGGFTQFAATKRVQLRRTSPQTGQPEILVINYRSLSNGASLTNDIVLGDGDVILVPERRLFE